MGDISIRFDRLERLGAGDIDEQNFLKDLREYMPRLSNNNNFLCCQGSESSPDNSLYICAQVSKTMFICVINSSIEDFTKILCKKWIEGGVKAIKISGDSV